MSQEYSSHSSTVISGGSVGGPSKKKLLVLGAVVVLVIVVGVVLTAMLHKPGNTSEDKVVAISNKVANVSITPSGYAPQTVTVKAGQQVTFTNSDSTMRQLTADPTTLPGFSTIEPLDQGDTYTFIFDQKGTYKYYDATDPAKFVGTVTVQ